MSYFPYRWRIGGRPTNSVADFWELSVKVQDPAIPQLPLEEAGDSIQPLTGLQATAAQGALGLGYVYAVLTGQAATTGFGVLVPQLLVGQAATSAAGVLTPEVNVTLTGQSATATVGVLTPNFDLALTGQAAASAHGTISAGTAVSVALLGIQLTATRGTLIPQLLIGRRLTLTQGRLYPPSATVELLGFRAEVLGGQMLRFRGIDTFTDTNGTALGSHTADGGETWTKITSSGGVGDPQIQTNRLQNQNGEYHSAWYVGTEDFTNAVVQAEFRYAGPSDGSGVMPHESIGARMQTGANFDGYYFGYWDAFSTYVVVKRVGGVVADFWAAPTTYSPTGTEQHTLRMEVFGNRGVEINAYLDGERIVHLIDESQDLGAGKCGVALGTWDEVTAFTREWTLPTFWWGSMGDNIVYGLLQDQGRRATFAQGVLEPFIDGEAEGAVLNGHMAQTAAGTITPYHTVGELVGNAVTATGGVIVPTFILGVETFTPIAFTPHSVATITAYGGGDWHRPHNIQFQPFSVNGKLLTTGWEYLPTFIADGTRIGDIAADQRLLTWIGFGTQSTDPIATSEFDEDWPRNNFPWATPLTYNDFGASWGAVDPNLTIHTGTVREYEDGINSPQRQFGWQPAPITSATSALRYNGPELIEDVGAFYPYSGADAVALYSTKTVRSGANVTVYLNGWRTRASNGTVGKTNVGTGGTTGLVGRAATTGQGVIKPTGTGVSIEQALTGLRATCSIRTPVLLNTSDNTYLALRSLRYNELFPAWSSELWLGIPTGTAPFRPLPRYITFVPSGSPGIFYVVYVSDVAVGRDSLSLVIYDTYIGLAVVNMTTRTVVSHTTTYSHTSSNPGIATPTHNMPKAVADVLRRADGTCYSQFLLGDAVVHLAWTTAGYTTPTLTIKTGPSPSGGYSPIAGMGAFEQRGEYAYFVVQSGAGNFVNLAQFFVNDVTSSSSSWTVLTNGTATGQEATGLGGEPLYERREGELFLGSGGQYPSVVFWSGIYDTGFGGADSSVEVWTDLWQGQSKLFTLSTQGAVGHVKVSITPNAALTGLSATVAHGSFLGIAAGGSRTRQLTGLRATATTGLLEPPRIFFLVDTFTDTNGTHLISHTGEVGATWTDPNDTFWIQFGAAEAIVDGAFGRAYASGVSPTRDYKVTANVSGGSPFSGTHGGTDIPELAIGVRCDDHNSTTNGYFFGYHPVYDKWYVFKPNTHGEPTVLYSAEAISATNPISIEVNGVNPTRITCRFGDSIFVDLLDYGHQYYDPGVVTLFMTGISGKAGVFHDIEGYYYDPSLIILTGQRATFTQGALDGPWLRGQRATFAQGEFTIDGSTPAGATLTGLSATVSQGTIFPVMGVGELTGIALTIAQGIITPPTFVVSLGRRANVYGGLLAPLTGELVGIRILAIRGDVYPLGESNAALLGVAATSALGTLRAQIATALLGLASTTDADVVTPTVAAPYYSTGAAASVQGGVLTPSTSVSVALTGLPVAATQGVMTPGSALTQALTGASATAGFGTILPVVTVGATGTRATTGAGVLLPLVSVSLTGQPVVSAAGVLQLLTNIFLTGQACTTSAGLVTAAHDSNVVVTGVWAVGVVGSLDLPDDLSRVDVWAKDQPDELTARLDAVEEFVRT